MLYYTFLDKIPPLNKMLGAHPAVSLFLVFASRINERSRVVPMAPDPYTLVRKYTYARNAARTNLSRSRRRSCTLGPLALFHNGFIVSYARRGAIFRQRAEDAKKRRNTKSEHEWTEERAFRSSSSSVSSLCLIPLHGRHVTFTRGAYWFPSIMAAKSTPIYKDKSTWRHSNVLTREVRFAQFGPDYISVLRDRWMYIWSTITGHKPFANFILSSEQK